MNDFQNLLKSKVSIYKYPLLLLLFVFIAYLPLASFQFSLKNDAFTDNFPNKYFFSEALHNGIFPLWNPYINFGFPIYADFGFAYYHPVTWAFGALGYTPYTLTVEVLFYLVIAAWGMYLLANGLLQNKLIAFLCGAMYVGCGFFLGNLQHINFITGAAMLPFVFLFFIRLLHSPAWRNSVALAIAGYLLLASGHPALPIATLYCLLFLLITLYVLKQVNSPIADVMKHLILSLCIIAIAFAPAIYAYINILPHYGITQNGMSFNPGAHSTVSSLLTLIFPVAGNGSSIFWGNDISMRNWFFSLAGLLFSIYALASLRNKYVTAFFIVALCMFFFSINGAVRDVLFHNLPLLGYIRTNGEFRIFSILFLVVSAGFGIRHFYETAFDFRKVKWILLSSIFLMAGAMVYLIAGNHLNFAAAGDNFTVSRLKESLSTVTFNDLMFFNLLLTSATLVAILALHKKINALKWIVLSELVMVCWLCLPFTGVGQTPLKSIQEVLNKMPKSFPAPPLQPVSANDTFPANITSLLGDASYYNKQIGVRRLTDYPSYFRSIETTLKNDTGFLQKPFVFFSDSSTAQFQISKFSPQNLELEYSGDKESELTFLQNKYPFWKAEIDDQPITIEAAYGSFIKIKVPEGRHSLNIYYSDPVFKLLFFVSAGFLFLLFVMLFLQSRTFNSI